ncbi:Hpt domain-containing protein [Isoptericola halotolerans]|uniref:Hpt domain-containing protein n=1 Tax=Isoptericola halotolerans TaxID=300560 RepID=UPI00388F0F99
MSGERRADDGRADDRAMDDAVARLAGDARRRNLARAERVLVLLGPAPRGQAGRDGEAREEAALLCHSMAGSAGTFGDDELAAAALHLESVLLDGAADRVPAAVDRLRESVDALRP